MALGCAGAALAAAGCGLTNASSKTETTTVTRTVTRTVTAPADTTSSTSTTTATAAPCDATQLHVTFAAEPGSAGAGNIVYKLTVTNASSSSCSVGGLPAVQLLDASHKALPTHPTAQFPGENEPQVTLAAGDSTTSEARFSPDVNGVGESSNPCEAKASFLRVTFNGGYVDAGIDPPTSVCSHGLLQLTAYGR